MRRRPIQGAGTQKPIALRGVVTQVVPEWRGFSVQDGTDGVYVEYGKPLPPGLRVGQKILVEGWTSSGNFAPLIKADNVRILGPGRMPHAHPVTWQELATGSCDNDYVELEGVVRSAGMVKPPAWDWSASTLRLDIGGNFIWAYLRDDLEFPRELLVDATVRLRGVCLVFSNSQRQFQGSALSIVRAADLEVLQSASRDPFDAPLQLLSHLFGFRRGAISFHRVRIQGIATLQVPGAIYLQQGQDAVQVRVTSDAKVRPGDRVEAVGFPTAGGYSTVLDDGLIRVTGHGPELAPRDVRAENVLSRIDNAPAVPTAVLVRVHGQVLERSRSARNVTLLLADGGTSFSARVPAASETLDSIRPGSRVAVTGVCTVQVNDRGLPQSFELLSRSPQDVQVLERPPWLSRRMALDTAAALFAFLIAAVVGLALLRRRLAKQTATMRRQFEREASLEQRYSDLVENASDLVYVRDLGGRLLHVNRGAEEMTGFTRSELLGSSFLDLLVPEERERARDVLASHPGQDANSSQEWRFLTKDGRERIVETKQRYLNDNGRPARVECIGRDVTARQQAQAEAISDRNHMEEQLRHSQKLESLGQLAGGVAHDFNNLLTVISGYAQMILSGLPGASNLQGPIGQIALAADRAADLTRQLLLFSRRQAASVQIICVDELLRHIEKMLRRLIGEDTELALTLDAAKGSIRADPGHIEQVVMNLVVNARDAMPEGGRLAIRTACLYVDAQFAGLHLGIEPGDYVTITVTDTGGGMSPEVRARVFEPFFTTKPQGKGTGLGLSTVYGIVKQNGGAILVQSDPGCGTTFEILFPASEASAEQAPEQVPNSSAVSGAETILVTEDEAGVRSFIRDVLLSHGYTVLEAANGKEALERAAQYPGTIHLLLSDLVMPEMGGVALAERFREVHPEIPVLHMSGYTDRLQHPPLSQALLEKPFSSAALLTRIRAILSGTGTMG